MNFLTLPCFAPVGTMREMEKLQHTLKRFDGWQQTFPPLAIIISVIKKYGEDRGGFQGALITYYGFLSLFPLLLILVSLLHHLPEGNRIATQVANSITGYIPVLGNSLQSNVHGYKSLGLDVVFELFVLLYGARGVADAFRHTVNTIWRIPEDERSGFWAALLKNYTLVFIGGFGFIAASVAANFAGQLRQRLSIHFSLVILSLVLLFGSFQFIMRVAHAKQLHFRDIWLGAALSTAGLFLLQNIGGAILIHELHNMNNIYGTFALVLSIIFWIYLQIQIILYGMELDTVRRLRLWPRKLL